MPSDRDMVDGKTRVTVPVRFRYTANPGGQAHEWLVENFRKPPAGPVYRFRDDGTIEEVTPTTPNGETR